MEDAIVISDDEVDIIDLTKNTCALANPSEVESNVVDLTANDVPLGPKHITHPYANSCDDVLSNSSSVDLSENEGTSNGSWRSDSSTTSIENDVLQEDISSAMQDSCSTYDANLEEYSGTALTLQEWSHLPTPACGDSSTDYASEFPNVNYPPQSDTGSISSVPAANDSDAQISPVNKALLYKLRYFKKTPVSHYFHRLQKPEKSRPLRPVPLSRMSIVNNTREESIHWGTLHLLSEFVNETHYPPKDIITHIIQSIMLGVEEQAVKNEAYMILMKVQKLHPATVSTVAWTWSLLCEVMERKENHIYDLFLQYVVQTLDDDFQIHLQGRCFQKSLCKAMLSCGKPNIKNVIAWLIHAVENACAIDVNMELDANSEYEQRVVFLLQRMLSIAVEVDNQPAMNSNRIAELLFPYAIVLKTRQQREMFLSSTENHLLRGKILELIFINSCEPLPPQNMPFSLCKILHFIANSKLLLNSQGPEWQRWDEILHHTCLMFFSLQRIGTDLLLTPITDRADKILQRPQLQSPIYEDITEADVEQCLLRFWTRMSLGSDEPAELNNRFLMLKALLLSAINRPIS